MKTDFSGSLRNAFIVVLLAAIWLLFAPVQFGGTASYVIIAGASMEPALHQGDLVIARQVTSYESGDITAYQHPKVGPVIHRIIDREGPYYTLQGDNNDWIDSYQPVNTEILGKSWLHIPGAAEKLLWLQKPLGLSLLSLSIGIMFLITITKKSERKKEHAQQDADMFTKWFKKTENLRLGEWVFPLAILLFAAILLGVFAFTRPEFETIPVDILYTHQGSFEYEGIGSPSVYEEGRVESGQAIFHALVQDLELSFTYALESNAPADLAGRYSMFLQISEPSGWQRTIELQPETDFQGVSFSTSTDLELDQIIGIVARMKERTGLSRQVFDVAVQLPIQLEGTLAGIEYQEKFTATLPLKLDDIELYISLQNPLGENGDPLKPETSAFLPNEELIPNSLNIFGLVLTIKQARQIALISGGVSLLLITIIMAPALAVSLRSESERIKLVHSDRLLAVQEIPADNKLKWIDVNSIEDLVKLSESSGALILHARDQELHTYVVKDGETGYRFIVHDPNGTESLTADDELDQGGE